MELGLAGRAVLVTGGSRGIGRAVARAFAAEGALTGITYHRDEEAARDLAQELGSAEGRALAVRYVLGEPDSATAAVLAIEKAWGRLDVVVANAAELGGRRRPGVHCEDVPADEWQRLMDANLAGTLRTVQAGLPPMRRAGWGRIVLVSSHITRDGAPGQEFYGAAKAALHGFARSLTWDVSADGVLVNVVCPGLTLTQGVAADLPASVREGEAGRTPTRRLSTPEEVAAAVLFLGSPANGHINGEAITVAGGR
ncbi:SDR family oxidoreductase (plasmid) [Streptomyces sp. NBC_00390]|uniref:SDR family NAD(P)-dependent oxidoreductase n=1 Tax=Streptomyces sp. NBC_00390 TaxID=2975736 RepID=UPI002E1AA84F